MQLNSLSKCLDGEMVDAWNSKICAIRNGCSSPLHSENEIYKIVLIENISIIIWNMGVTFAYSFSSDL